MPDNSNIKKIIDFNEIKLDIGESIQLQDPNSDRIERLFVKLIGYRSGKSILVTIPVLEGKEIQVSKGQGLIVRLFSVKTVYAFTVKVLELKRTPYPYMHLTFPSRVEAVVVRNAQRVSVELIVSVQNDDPDKNVGDAISAKLTDISIGGAKLTTLENIGELKDDISMSAKFKVGGVEQYVQILATIRRIDMYDAKEEGGKDTFVYGLEFRFVEETERLVLHAFVYEQLSQQ